MVLLQRDHTHLVLVEYSNMSKKRNFIGIVFIFSCLACGSLPFNKKDDSGKEAHPPVIEPPPTTEATEAPTPEPNIETPEVEVNESPAPVPDSNEPEPKGQLACVEEDSKDNKKDKDKNNGSKDDNKDKNKDDDNKDKNKDDAQVNLLSDQLYTDELNDQYDHLDEDFFLLGKNEDEDPVAEKAAKNKNDDKKDGKCKKAKSEKEDKEEGEKKGKKQ